MKKVLSFFRGTESAKEEKAEKKLTPAQYAKGEKKEGAKSTSAKKPMGTAAVKKPSVPVKKVAKKK